MFLWRGRSRKSETAATSVIDQGCDITGRLTFVGTLVLNGKFQGEMASSDVLVVAAQGELQANAEVGTAIIYGQVKGNIVARERVELQASARVVGDIESPVLMLEEGVAFDGQCKMKEKGPPRKAEGPEEEKPRFMAKGLIELRRHG